MEITNTFGVGITDALIEQLSSRLDYVFDESQICQLLPYILGVLVFGSEEKIDQIIDLIQDPVCLDDINVLVDASIGLAYYPTNSDKSAQLLRQAIIASHYAGHPADTAVNDVIIQRIIGSPECPT